MGTPGCNRTFPSPDGLHSIPVLGTPRSTDPLSRLELTRFLGVLALIALTEGERLVIVVAILVIGLVVGIDQSNDEKLRLFSVCIPVDQPQKTVDRFLNL